MPTHIAKAAVKKFPILGSQATAIGNLYVDRGDKDSKIKMQA